MLKNDLSFAFKATLTLLVILFIPLISASSFAYNSLDNTQTGTINNTYYNNTYINQSVNATVNETQFESNSPITLNLTWLSSWISSVFDSVYLSLTNYNYSVLTNDSMADTLHRHSELSASDGDPNPALQVDASGKIGIGMTGQTAQFHSKYSVPTSSRAWQLDYDTNSASTSPTGFRINATGSNSPNNNYILDGYYNNVAKFYIDVGGGLYLAGSINSAGLGVDNLNGITYAGNTNNLVSLRNPLEFVGTGYWSINNPRIYGGVTRYVSGSDYDTDLTASVYRNGTEQKFLYVVGNTTSPVLSFNPDGGSVKLPNDNQKLYLGAGDDASIYYDATNMNFNSQEVGTGHFIFRGGNIGIGNVTPVMPLQVNTLENRTNGTQKKVFSLLSTDSGFLGAGLYMAINGSTVSQAKRTADIQTALLNSDGSVNTADGTLQLQPLGGKVQIGTYTDGYATFFRRDSPSVTISNIPTGANDAIITTDAQAIDKGGALGLGGRTDSAGANGRFFAIITGRKENSVNNNQNGYMGFWINVAGTMVEWARANSTLFNINKNTSVSGNFNQTSGNATINMIYGSFAYYNETDGYTLPLSSPEVYANVTNWTSRLTNGVTMTGNTSFQVQYDGVYEIYFMIRYSDGANGKHGGGVFGDGVRLDDIDCYDAGHTATVGEKTQISDTCQVRLNSSQVITVQMDDHYNPVTNPTIYGQSLNFKRIGN